MFSVRKKLYACAVLLLPLATAAQTAVFYVDPTFQGENPSGTSWLSAFTSVQQAIDAAADEGGGEVWVKAGVHKPPTDSRTASIKLKPGVALYGGFRGDETTRNQRKPKINRTVLSGDVGRLGSTADNCFHVLTGCENIRIDGFIITRGNANSAGQNRLGGGLLLPKGAQGVTVANCSFEKNNAELGGAVYLDTGSLALTNCTFYSNSAESGGALALAGKTGLRAIDCSFSSGFAPRNGGGVFMQTGSKAVFKRCMFNFNSTDGQGGALFAETDQHGGILLEIEKGIFRQNAGRAGGGALAFKGPFVPMVTDSTFEGNRSGKGAGAIGIEGGASAVITGNTYEKNRGIKGSEDVAADEQSRIVESAEEAARLARENRIKEEKNAGAPAAASPANKPPPKRQLADVYARNDKGIKVKLRSIVAQAEYTVIAAGDLTDPDFILHYRAIEAAARDFAPRKVGFAYLYKYLTHPQNNGYIQPFNLQERARQAQLAREQLHTRVPWLCDEMDNQTAQTLIAESAANVFLFDTKGTELFSGGIDQPEKLRAALSKVAGRVDVPTPPDTLPASDLPPVNMVEPQLTKRIRMPVSAGFQPLEITPIESGSPFYVKLRAEGNPELLASGNGKLLLSFSIDSLYPVAWNNLMDPMKYTIKVPAGVVAPSINSAPRVTGQATDTEPREFLLETRKLDPSKPITLRVDYSILSKASRKNIAVSQQYIIYLQPDRFGGKVIGRQTASPAPSGASTALPAGNAYTLMLKRYDLDRNGRLSPDETVGPLRRRFQEADIDNDGYVDQTEYFQFREQR